MVKTVLVDEKGIRKGAWSKEEDEKLRTYVQRHGHLNWRLVPKFAGLSRCGKSCRLRWVNYLRPNVRRGNFTKEEEDLIIQMHKQLGNKWSKIASKFPGRTDNDIKNHWHTKLKKREKLSELAAASPGDQFKIVRDSPPNHDIETPNNDHNDKDEQAVDCNNTEMMFDNLGITEELIEDQGCGDFWNQPFIPDTTYDDTTYDNELFCFGNSTMLSLMDVGYVSWYDNGIDDLIGYI